VKKSSLELLICKPFLSRAMRRSTPRDFRCPDRGSQVRTRLPAGGRWIRTIGPRHERAGFVAEGELRDRTGAAKKGGELIECIAAGAPVRKLLFVEPLGDMRLPLVRHWPDHDAGVELATVDAHHAAEAATDIESGLDDGVESGAGCPHPAQDLASSETAGPRLERSPTTLPFLALVQHSTRCCRYCNQKRERYS